MPSAISPTHRAVSDEHNDHEFDDAIEDFLKDLPLEHGNASNNGGPADATKDIDEEIKIKKKRKPIPKLDDERLLSKDGIPRLRKITKTRLKFRGKGHEFSDISRLLNMYQLWLDDLYPRAKFRDALVMVEKVGHSKRMKVMRKAWLDDTKPYRKEPDTEELQDLEMSGALQDEAVGPTAFALDSDSDEEAIFTEAGQRPPPKAADASEPQSNGNPDEDELDALLAEHGIGPGAVHSVPTNRTKGPFEEDSDEDELDALVAAERNPTNAASTTLPHEAASKPDTRDDDFADEEEIMAGMHMW